MLSLSEVSRTDSLDVLVTVTENVTAPPGAGTVVGLPLLSTVTVGAALVIETVASSLSVADDPSLSVTVAVTTSVWLAPASPVNDPTNEQVYCPPEAASVGGGVMSHVDDDHPPL